ncbi:MAG: serine/threonine protein kinase [Candidatus Dadabacteria bacterium]|nr:MAG: serine/threonine protein kinase [Candidatus Dadabacteria bacterium]
MPNRLTVVHSDRDTIISARPVLSERFEVLRVLGEGAAGVVYLVRDRQRNGEKVALKVLTRSEAFDENTLERFKRELNACQKINHPNIVRAYELVKIEGALAFSMEYVEGQDLGKVFKKRKLAPHEIDHIFDQLLEALKELHQNNIYHRDLKLENVLIGKDGVVKLSDLGLMKHEDLQSLTKSGILLGTAQYMPPEYIKYCEYDARSDLYAVGVMLYEVVTGKRRLADKQGMEAIEYLLKTRFSIPKLTLNDVPRKYIAIIDKAMDPKASRRFQSAAEMQEAFVDPDWYRKGQLDAELKSGINPREFFRRCFSSRLLNVKAKRQPRSLALAGVVIAVLSFAFFSMWFGGPLEQAGSSQESYTLQPGKYKDRDFLELKVTSAGIFIDSSIVGCNKGFYDFHLQKLSCDAGSFEFIINSSTAKTIAGTLYDKQHNRSYHFKAKITSSG